MVYKNICKYFDNNNSAIYAVATQTRARLGIQLPYKRKTDYVISIMY